MKTRSNNIILAVFVVVLQFVVCSATVLGLESLSPAEQREFLIQANDLFHQANEVYATNRPMARELYSKSLLRFERLADSGIQNGKLFYNIGNIYFRLDDIGRAIVNYRRAEQFIPNDENLKQNLQYALAKRVDKIEEKQEERILKTVFFYHYDLSSKTRFIIFALFYITFWLGLSARPLIAKRFSRSIIVVPFIVSLLLLISLGLDFFSKPAPKGVIITSEVIARKGDGTSYQSSFNEPLHAGTDFSLIENRGGWLHIELGNGSRCWVPAASAELV